MNDPIAAAESLVAAHRHRDALAMLDRAGAGAGPVQLARAEALSGLERHWAAHEICQRLLREQGSAPLDLVAARVLDARILLRTSPAVDEAIELALDAAAEAPRLVGATAERRRELAGAAHLALAYACVRKRTPVAARRCLQAAHGQLGDDARVFAVAGRAALAFDQRAAAREQFQRALATGPAGNRLGLLGLGYVDGLVGDFDAAHARLAALEPHGVDDREALRLRLWLLQAQGRWREAVAVLDELLAGGAEADTAGADRQARAAALYRCGDRASALSAWQQVAVMHPREPVAQSARRNVARLSRPEAATARRQRLAAFPTVAQLHNHCGPAAVELYMRFFGLPAEQVEVARAVQTKANGTPVYRLRRHLEDAGFAAHRIEADLDCMRRLLDAGMPVIVEEDYSESRHVAVAIGYDDALEVLLVQDPMSHEVRETPYEQLATLRQFSNHGALVAVPRADVARLDAAGVAECRYIALVDEAWAAAEAGAPERADQLVDEAVQLRADYELAWLHRFLRARAAAEAAGPADGPARARLRELVAEIATRWPDDEWPQQLVGEVALVERRFAEALRAFETARNRDPGDSRNWMRIADCHLLAGREDDAHAALTEALRRNPAHARANQAQAAQYLRLGRLPLAAVVNEVASELVPQNPFNHSLQASILTSAGDFEGALAAWQSALGLLPGHLPFVVERARLLARMSRIDEAVAALTAAVRERPGEAALRVDLAELLYRHGRHEAAIEACRELQSIAPGHPSAHAITGAALCASGKLDPGLAELQKALRLRPTFTWAIAELGVHLGVAGRHGDALFAAAAAFGLSGAPAHELGLAAQLAAAGAAPEAAARARRALASARLADGEWARAIALVVAGEGVAAAHQLLVDLARRAPPRPDLLREHARLLVETFWLPGWAEDVLQRLGSVLPEHPLALAASGYRLLRSGPEAFLQGEQLLRTAISRSPTLAAPRRWLAEALCAQGRHAEALMVLQPCPASFVDGDLRVQALLGLDQRDEAEAIVAGLGQGVAAGGPQDLAVAVLRYRLARHRGDWTAALALAEQVARGAGEREDDGRLGTWERARFECLLRLGELLRACRFGEQQATTAEAAARLAHTASELQAHDVASHFVALALQRDPREPLARSVQAVLSSRTTPTDRPAVGGLPHAVAESTKHG